MDWLQRLKLTEQDEKIINKLRVCHKHFKNSDYSCARNIRRLVDRAVPSLNLICEDQIEIQQESQQETEIFQQEIDHSEVENIIDAQVENITDHERLMQHDQSIQLIKQDVQMINEQSDERLMQHDESIQLIRQDVQMIKEQLKTQEFTHQEALKEIMEKHDRITKKRRPNLLRITRKQRLPSIARKFYDSTIKLQKETRRLRKIVKGLKNDMKSKTVTLNTTNHKGKKDRTAVVRQRFMDMIIRNDRVAPQVKIQSHI